MPSSRRLVLAALALAATACSGGDDDGDAVDTVPSTSAAAPTTTAPAGPTTLPLPETSTTECEDVPVAADYPAGLRPRAFRPCTLPTQLAAHVIISGTGRPAANGDTVIVDYTGVRAADGTLFDSSYLRDLPLDFELGRGNVIAGWEQGLTGATAGSLIKLDVPADLAYGNSPPSDAIQPGDALTFVIEVRAVVAPVTADQAPIELLTTPSPGVDDVVMTEVTPGQGAAAETGRTAVAHMLLARGDTLDVLLDTWAGADPLQVIIEDGDTLPGIVSGLRDGRVGAVRVITVPPHLAFGPDGNADLGLPPDTDLIIVAEIVGVY